MRVCVVEINNGCIGVVKIDVGHWEMGLVGNHVTW